MLPSPANFGRIPATLAAVQWQLELKLQPANALHGMQIGLGLAAKAGNMQVGRINLAVPANKFAGRMNWWCLFRAFFFCPEPPNRRLFCSSRLFGESARVGEWYFGSQVHMLPIFKCNI
jgi:hypothetical protein